MKATTSLSEKTDQELAAMVRELAALIDAIGQEQTCRISAERRRVIAAENSEENEGGIPQATPPK